MKTPIAYPDRSNEGFVLWKHTSIKPRLGLGRNFSAVPLALGPLLLLVPTATLRFAVGYPLGAPLALGTSAQILCRSTLISSRAKGNRLN